MTLPIVEDIFPGFADAGTRQPYDTPDGAAEAVARFERALAADLEGRAAGEAATQAHRLVDALDATVASFVAAMMPPELATESSDFAVEDGQGARLSLEDQLARLRKGADPQDEARLRVANTTLEQTCQALLDHLSAARIAEEMDTPTYVERLRGAFKRVRDGSRAQGARLGPHLDRARIIAARLSVAAQVLGILRDGALPRLAERGDETAAFETALTRLEGFVDRARGFADHVRAFLDTSLASLTRLHRDVAAQANMAGAEGESTLVSREIERKALFRPLPLVWALFITFLVKIVLAHNTGPVLHDLAIPILVLSFVLTWTLSIYIGVWARARRMREVQAHTRRQLRQVLMADAADAELVEFPRIAPGHMAPRPEPVAPFAYRGHAARHRKTVLARNLAALAIPAVLLLMVLVTRNEAEHDFVARFDGAEPCVLASGRLVFATPGAYFVQGGDDVRGPFAAILARVFPELLADVVARADIIGIAARPEDRSALPVAEGAAPAARLPDCLMPRPGRAEAGSVTVDLGDTSLSVLSQAFAGGGAPGPVAVDPVIVDARTTIELELARSDPAQIDVSAILAALTRVRQHFDNDITLAEALNIVFTGAPTRVSASTRLDLPDALLAFFGDGEGGLPGEVRALRLALAASNDLAADVVARLDLGQSDAALVAMLDQRLTALIDGQDDLRIALTQGMGAGGPVVVTPALIGPPGRGEGGALGGVSATIFQTAITLPGGEGRLQTLDNTLVLPFFPAPVASGDGRLETPQGAFDWGADPRRLNDPVVTAEKTTYFGRIAQTLESCLADNATVEIDLIGLASPSWDGPAGSGSGAVLNFHLAEGRRIGALRRLAELMDATAARRVKVQIADGTVLPMPDLIAASRANAADAFLARFGRFGSRDAFEARRDTLLGVTGLDPDAESPLEELFGRSVVLRMIRTEGGPCAF